MRLRAVSALTAACAFWGIGFPVTKALTLGAKHAGPGMSSWFFSAYFIGIRFLAGALVVAAIARALPTRSELVQGLALGAVTGMGMLLQLDGLQYTEASTNAFLTQGYVLFLPIASFFITGKAPPIRVVVSALLVMVGLAVLARFDPVTLSIGRGEAETLAAAFCFVFQILLLDARRFANNRTLSVSAVMFGTMALVTVPALALTAQSAEDFRAPFAMPLSGAYVLLLAALPTLGSFLLMNRYQKLVSATEAGIIYATEPVFASAFALFVPGWISALSGVAYADERIDRRLVVGGMLVVCANVLLVIREPSQGAPVEPLSAADLET